MLFIQSMHDPSQCDLYLILAARDERGRDDHIGEHEARGRSHDVAETTGRNHHT